MQAASALRAWLESGHNADADYELAWLSVTDIGLQNDASVHSTNSYALAQASMIYRQLDKRIPFPAWASKGPVTCSCSRFV